MTQTTTSERALTIQGGIDAISLFDVAPATQKSIEDILGCSIGTPQDELDKLRFQLEKAAVGEQVERFGAAAKAEAIYAIQADGIWAQLKNPDTGELYKWHEFREVLADLFGISRSSLGNYLKDARFADRVLMLEQGEMTDVGGLSPVRAFVKLVAGIDARANIDIRQTARPVSVEAERWFVENYGEPPVEEWGKDWTPIFQQAFKDHYARNDKDPSSINKTPFELHQTSNHVNGAGSVVFWWANDEATLIKWKAEYPPERNADGTTSPGEVETGLIKIEEFLPTIVRDRVVRGLKIMENYQ